MKAIKDKEELTNVKISYGKFVIGLPYRYVRPLGTFLCFYYICVLVFLAELLNVSLQIKSHIGDYLNMADQNGWFLVLVLGCTTTIVVLLTLALIVTVIKVITENKTVNYYLLLFCVIAEFILLLCLIVLMIMVMVHGYDTDPKHMVALLNSMKTYGTDGMMKTKLDILQIELQCCGSRNYSDWYEIDWYDRNFLQNRDVIVVGEAPFSCCSIRTSFPCIHHGVEKGFGAYNYDIQSNFSLSVEGCWSAINNRRAGTSWQVLGYLLALFILLFVGWIPLRLLQTASNEFRGFPRENYTYTAWLIGLYRGAKRDSKFESN